MNTATQTEPRIVAKGKHFCGKTDYNGSGRRNCAAYLKWELRETPKGLEFSACGEIWNPRQTNCYTCGQCVDKVAELFPSDQRAQAIRRVWERWHLNGMRAGCEHQRAEGWNKRPIDPAKPLNTYGKHFPGQRQETWNMLAWVRQDEHPEGLLCRPCPVCGYRYGSAWLHEPMPQAVVDEVLSWVPKAPEAAAA